MLDLRNVTPADFEAVLGSSFQLADGDALQLHKISLLPSPSPRQQAFSLYFTHPSKVMPQGIHHLSHAQLGDMEVFLVPLQPDGHGRLYEAVFN